MRRVARGGLAAAARVFGGAHDVVIPFRNSRALARELPDSELARLDDAAHMSQMQLPDIVNAAPDRLLMGTGVVANTPSIAEVAGG